MKVNSIEVTNWLCHRHATVMLSPMTIVAGDNGAGKTALAHALSFGMTGDLCRVAEKGERKRLLTDGAAKGTVKIGIGSEVLERDIATGKLIRSGAFGPGCYDALPVLLEPQTFGRIDGDARRVLLRAVLNAEPDKKRVGAELAKRGIGEAVMKKLQAITGELDVWATVAREEAAQSRGAWKSTTGEQYGSAKAAAWASTVEGVEPTDAEIANATAQLALKLQAMEKAQQAVGAAAAHGQIRQQRLTELERFRTLVNQLPGLEAQTKDIKQAEYDAHDVWRNAADDATTLRQRAIPDLACPHCGCFVTVGADRQLHMASGTIRPLDRAELDAATEKEKAAKEVMDTATATRQAHMARLAMGQEQRDRLAELERMVGVADVQSEPEPDSKEAVENAREDHQAAQSALDALTRQAERFKAAREQTEKAARHHFLIEQWTLVQKLLAPDGIPGEILADAMRPMMEELRQVATETGWQQVTIGADMAILADGRPYDLLSESERWRADASIAVVLAKLSGLRLVVLDRFDVLGVKHRNPAMTWLYKRVTSGQLETCLLLATMKDKPAAPKAVNVIWLGLANEQRAAA